MVIPRGIRASVAHGAQECKALSARKTASLLIFADGTRGQFESENDFKDGEFTRFSANTLTILAEFGSCPRLFLRTELP
jgi:hypothetical protein